MAMKRLTAIILGLFVAASVQAAVPSFQTVTNIFNALIGTAGGATNGIPKLNGFGTNTTLINVDIYSGNGVGLTNLNNVFTNQAKTWYVDSNGFSDAKKGNPGHPCNNFMQVATNSAYGDIIHVGPGLFYADEFEVPGVAVIGSGRGITRFTNSTPLTTVCFYICDSNTFANFSINSGTPNPFNLGDNPTFSPPYTGGGLENVEITGQGDAIQGFNGRWIDGYVRNCTFNGNWDLLRFGAGSRVEISDCDFNLIGGPTAISPILRGLYLVNTSTGMVSRCNFTFTGMMPTNDVSPGTTNCAVTMDYGTIGSIVVRVLTTNESDITWFYFSTNTVVSGAFAPVSEISGSPTYVGGFSGANLITDSVNSNKLDAPTRLLLGGAGSQTPYTSDHNGAGFGITNLSSLSLSNSLSVSSEAGTNLLLSVFGTFTVSNSVSEKPVFSVTTAGNMSGNGSGITNSPFGGLDFANNFSVTTNNVALKIPAFTNGGVIYYMILFTNGP